MPSWLTMPTHSEGQKKRLTMEGFTVRLNEMERMIKRVENQ